MTEAAELIARIRANVDELQTGMQKADNIVKQGASQLNETAKTAGTGMGNAMGRGMDTSLEPAIGQALSRVSPALGSIVTAAGPAAIALAAVTAGVMAFKQAWSMAEQGAGASELAAKYVEISGGIAKSEEMMQKLRQATKGTVADTDLMVLANRSLNMGITSNADEMARLVAYFQELGDASGMGSQEAISAGMQALGALQTRGLKTLGLSLDDSKIFDAYAAKLGTVASELDDVQKRAALVQAVLAQSPQGLVEAAGSSADKAEAMHVSIKNLNTSIGRSIEGMLGLGNVVNDVANKANDALSRARQAPDIFKPYWDAVNNLPVGFERLRKSMDLTAIEKAFKAGTISGNDLDLVLHGLIPTVENLNYEAYASASASAAAASSLGVFAFSAMDAENRARSAAQGVAELAAQMAHVAGLEYYQFGYANIEAAGGYVAGPSPWAMGMSPSGGAPKTQSKTWGSFGGMAEGYPGYTGGGGGGSSSQVAEARAQAAELRSIAEGLLKPSYRGPKDLIGPYVEQWDEYARKMNAIADDQGSIWRKMVPKDIMDQGQEAIAKWARSEEEAFYAGKRLGEVDWNKFIEDAKKQVEASQAKEDMVQMAMQKLAEAHITGVNAAEVLGLNSPGAQIGADAAKSFAQGAVGTDVGLSVTTAFGDSITANAKTWESYGAVAIGYFISGGQKGITPQTGAAFAAMIYPYLKPLIGDPTLTGLRASGL